MFSRSEKLFLLAYLTIQNHLGWLWKFIWNRRLRQGKETKETLKERQGVASIPRPKGPIFWMHGASLGEMQALMVLVNYLSPEFPDVSFLITTQTLSSRNVFLKTYASSRCIHQMFPQDHPKIVQCFLDYWKPNRACFFGEELWPTNLHLCFKNNIPLCVLDFHLSEKSYRIWKKAAAPLFRAVYKPLVQLWTSRIDCQKRFMAVTGQAMSVGPSLKWLASSLSYDEKELEHLRAYLFLDKDDSCQRPMVFASCIYPEEHDLIMNVYSTLKQSFPQLLLFYAPRRLEKISMPPQWKSHHRSKTPYPSAATDIFIIDTFGELGLFYALKPIVILGGSFFSKGGHNVLEPARMGCVVLHGPFMENNRESSLYLQEQKACFTIEEPILSEKLVTFLKLFLNHPTHRLQTQQRAFQALSDLSLKNQNFLENLKQHFFTLP